MKKIALSFPGQGSQYVGMGSDLLESKYQQLVKNRFTQASELLGYDAMELCLQGPEEKLKLTQFTQPMIFLISSICSDIIKQQTSNINLCLGHSIGEYAALYSCGVISFEQGIDLTFKRARAMSQATPSGVGAMHAIMRVPETIIRKICTEVSSEQSQVVPANFNTPGQIVISGHIEACNRFLKKLESDFQEGPYRVIELKVSAPFHSPLMIKAQEIMSNHLKNFDLNSPEFSYIANVDAKEYNQTTSSDQIKENLIKQISSSVLWTQSVEAITQDHLIIDMGPGKVTSGLIRKINRDLKILSFEKDKLYESDLDTFV